jgi:alkanesulfonate monooxygenase SsuD/methylene tetrahydromethanopterin reductase-like flavin-dependent oxidoreductase (luciferase family)
MESDVARIKMVLDARETAGSGRAALKVGLIVNQEEQPGLGPPRWADVRAVAEEAERAGFDSLWVVDHFLWRSDPWQREGVEGPLGVLECWTTLAALASVTSRPELGTLVTCTAHRHPALLAKMADSVEEVSGGRLILGLGAGDYEPEHHMLGQSFDRPVARFEEALQIIVPLLRTGSVDFSGEFYEAHDFELRPRGPRPDGPPIMIGALAHRPRMLRLTAQFADIWNMWAGGIYVLEETDAIVAAVEAACRKHGRDPATLGRSAMLAVALEGPMTDRRAVITGTPGEIAGAIAAFGKRGFEHVQIGLFPTTSDSVRRFAPILERIRADHDVATSKAGG